MLATLLVLALGAGQALVAVQALYLYFPLAGALLARWLPDPQPDAPAAPPGRLAVLIAAHDEAAVIGGALDALAAQTYPALGYDVFVVADGCTDETVALARRAGATTFERAGEGPSTKGQALRWLWQRVRPYGHAGVVVLDADNEAAPDFLAAIAAELGRGHAVVQGLRRAKSSEGGTTGLDALTELCTHRIGAAGRVWMGLGAPLMGSGVGYQAAVFDHLIADVGETVVEDCEWQARLALAGRWVHWTDRAVVYDEKTARPEAMGTQRTRWLAGRGQVARAYVGPLLARFGRTGDLRALDTALYLVAPPRSLLLAALAGFTGLALVGDRAWAGGAMGGAGLPGVWPLWGWLALDLGFVAYVLAGLALDGARWREYGRLGRSLAQLPRFTWQMTRASWQALTGAAVRWVPTPHGRTP